MSRLRWAILVFGLVLLAVAPSSGQDKKADKDDPKVKNALPAHWKDLNLSAEQKDKVYKIHAEYKTKIDDLEKKVKELKADEYSEKVKVLTDDQKKKLKETVIPDDPTGKEKKYEGKFISLKDDKLTINVGDKDHEFNVKDVKDLPKADDFKKDSKVSITTKDDKVTKVEIK